MDNMKANIQEAKFHPKDDEQFLDVKYSSIAGQLGYMAAMILVDGFVVKYPLRLLNFMPHGSSATVAAEEEKRQKFMNDGLNSLSAYNTILKMNFPLHINKMFNSVHSSLHIDVHYTQNPLIDTYNAGLVDLETFASEFIPEAEKKLKAAGVST